MGLLNQQDTTSTTSAGLLARSGIQPDSNPIGGFGLPDSTTSNSTPSTTTFKYPDVVGIAKSVGQSFLRGTAAAGAAIAGIPGQIAGLLGNKPVAQSAFTPAPEETFLGQLERNLYGTDQPISFQTVGEEFPFVQKGSTYAPIIGAAGSIADLFGGGGEGVKNLANLTKAIAKTADVTETANILRRAGFAEDLIKDAAPNFAKLTDTAEIERGLARLNDIQKGTIPVTEATKASAGLTDTFERGFIATTNDVAPELAQRVAGQYIPRSTDVLAIQAKNFIKDDIQAAEALARTGSGDHAVATAAELIKKYTDDAFKATDTGVKNALYDKAAEIANVIATKLTDAGRTVQAASILGRLTPEGMVRFAAREIQKYNAAPDGFFGAVKKIPELTGEQTAQILSTAKEIEALPDGLEKSKAFFQLQEHIASLVPSTMYQKLVAVWKAGLLTGVKTSGLNTLSNLFHGVSELAKDIPAAAVDSVAALFTGQRTVGVTARGIGKGLSEGFSKGWEYLRTGFDERNIADKLDLRKVNFGKSTFARAIQAYEEGVFRLIGSEDQPFYYGAKAHSLYSQAIAMAKNEKLTGEAAAKRVSELVQNPTDEMLKYATFDAETAVFQNSTALARVARGLQNLPGGQLIVPFGKTPSSVAMQVINYSPAGVVKSAIEMLAKGEFDQRLFSQAFGRSAVGTAAMYAGYKLAEQGKISTGRPTSETDINQAQLEGKAPNSILIDGKWRSLNTLGPAGFEIILGAYLHDGIKATGSITQGLVQMAAAVPKTLTDQTFLRGLDQFVSAITDPVKNGKTYFAGLLASIVPTLVSDVARATDSVERRTSGFVDRVQSRIPGARQALEPQVDALGQVVKTPNPLEVMADPTRPMVQSKDPVTLELKRLDQAGYQATPTQLGDKNGFDVLTPAQNTALWERSGQLLHDKLAKLFQTADYQNADDEQRQKIVKTFTDKAKLIARVEMVISLTNGLNGDALRAELSKLKEGKLLTKEVLSKYAELR